MKFFKQIVYALSFALIFTACSSDDDHSSPEPPAGDLPYQNGIFISNEGPFGNGSGTVTYISEDFSTVEQDIYYQVNRQNLGNIVQSMNLTGENAYIVVNNSQKVMIADRNTFEAKDSIVTGLENPRYFISNGQTKGYISDWGDPIDESDDYIAVVDLRTHEITTTIPVDFGPEKMLEHNSKIYVAHQGGYGHNNQISVISGLSVETTIRVGDAPESMVILNDNLYVLCSGKPDYTGNETPGSLVKIDLNSHEVTETFSFENTEHPELLTSDAGQLYYNLDGVVYRLNSESVSLPGEPVIEGFFYAMEAKDGKLYATDAKDYASRGSLYVYDLNSKQQIQEVQTGIIPGGIYFNK